MQELQKKDFWGPLSLPPRLTGVVYNDILHTVVPEPLQDEDPQTRIHLWIMYDNDLHFFLQFKSPMCTHQFFLVWLCRFTFCSFGCVFFIHPVSNWEMTALNLKGLNQH